MNRYHISYTSDAASGSKSAADALKNVSAYKNKCIFTDGGKENVNENVSRDFCSCANDFPYFGNMVFCKRINPNTALETHSVSRGNYNHLEKGKARIISLSKQLEGLWL